GCSPVGPNYSAYARPRKGRCRYRHQFLKGWGMGRGGIEPSTRGFSVRTGCDYPKPAANKTKENRRLIGFVFALDLSCFRLFVINIGTKPAQFPRLAWPAKRQYLTALAGNP